MPKIKIFRKTARQQLIDNWQTNERHCIGVIHGHVHWDYFSKGNKTFNVIDHTDHSTVLTRVGSYGDFYEYGQGKSEYNNSVSTVDAVPISSYRNVPQGAVAYGRNVSDATQALWTIAVIDKTNHKIDFVRFGAGGDLTIDYLSDTVTAVTGITLDKASGSLNTVSDKILMLTATVKPENATNKAVNWSSSDTNVATVSNGVVTATGEGSCIITATTDDGGFTATCSIVVADGRTNLLTSYEENKRLNSSGEVVAGTGKYTTDFIPITQGQKVTLKNIQVNTAAQDNNYIAFYDSKKNLISGCSRYAYAWWNHTMSAITPATRDSNNYLTSFTATGATVTGVTYNLDNVAYFRISANLIDSTSEIYVE